MSGAQVSLHISHWLLDRHQQGVLGWKSTGRHPPGGDHKLNWIYGPRQICQIDFSRHLHRKHLSDAQKRGLNFQEPSAAASVFGFLSKSCMTRQLTRWMAGAQKLAPLMGFWDLNDGGAPCLFFLTRNGYVPQWKHKLIFVFAANNHREFEFVMMHRSLFLCQIQRYTDTEMQILD